MRHDVDPTTIDVNAGMHAMAILGCRPAYGVLRRNILSVLPSFSPDANKYDVVTFSHQCRAPLGGGRCLRVAGGDGRWWAVRNCRICDYNGVIHTAVVLPRKATITHYRCEGGVMWRKRSCGGV